MFKKALLLLLLILAIYLAILSLRSKSAAIGEVSSKSAAVMSTSSTFHAGCYDTQNPFHTEAMMSRIAGSYSEYKAFNILNNPRSRQTGQDFQRKVDSMLKSFQRYVAESTRLHFDSEKGAFERASAGYAWKSFTQCKDEVHGTQANCVQIDTEFKAMKVLWQSEKAELERLIEKELVLEKQFVDFTLPNPTPSSTPKPSEPTELWAQLTEWKNKKFINHDETTKTRNKIEELQCEKKNLVEKITKCKQNFQLYQYCQSIIEKISKFGTEDFRSKTHQLVVDDQRSVERMQYMMKNHLQMIGEQKESLKLEIHIIEERIVQNIQILSTHEDKSNLCLECSKESVLQMQRQAASLSERIVSHTQRLEFLEREGKKIVIMIEELERKIKQFNRPKNPSNTPGGSCVGGRCLDRQQNVIKIEKQLIELRGEISKLRVSVRTLGENFSIKNSEYEAELSNINKISTCLHLKQYYEELKKKSERVGGGGQVATFNPISSELLEALRLLQL